VPPTDPESNYAAAKAVWLEPAGVPLANIHRMRADDADLFVAATAYESEMRAVLGATGQLDFVLLGVGPDGHVASLFPGHTALSEQHRLVIAVMDAPKPPPRRLTMTMPVLADAERLIVMAFGASKSAVLGEALHHEQSPLPVAVVLRRSRRPLVLADRDAARLMASGPKR
jgi:6-phosphogluconolactonase